ncbi:MAG: DUF1990 family protein [Ornithinibacter sp.]
MPPTVPTTGRRPIRHIRHRCVNGFAYGTLHDHPGAGQEQFLLEQHDDGSIEFRIGAFSRPESTLAVLAGPVSGLDQHDMTSRNLKALDRLQKLALVPRRV